ncbi:unnamed protein product [Musa acuminata subsp. malaccensis]|uniref:(wild Malaysian banana) hypothetical protein n=1 Tax=Musa acuminata subsp. malaccensis TaxID=214687 RepID=A0A804JUD9_MUSAM|nr:unnamed protein product [Musa acuminata subsp. malaccensis]
MASQCSLVKTCSETQFDGWSMWTLVCTHPNCWCSPHCIDGKHLMILFLFIFMLQSEKCPTRSQPIQELLCRPQIIDGCNWYFSSLFHVLFLCFWNKHLNLLAQACIRSHYMQS